MSRDGRASALCRREKPTDFQFAISSFLDGEDRSIALPVKRRKKLCTPCYLAGRFEGSRRYTEKESSALVERYPPFMNRSPSAGNGVTAGLSTG